MNLFKYWNERVFSSQYKAGLLLLHQWNYNDLTQVGSDPLILSAEQHSRGAQRPEKCPRASLRSSVFATFLEMVR